MFTPRHLVRVRVTLTLTLTALSGLLVNNVGTNLRKPSTEYTDEEYEMLHATNQASP